jgi:hypothetical protein
MDFRSRRSPHCDPSSVSPGRSSPGVAGRPKAPGHGTTSSSPHSRPARNPDRHDRWMQRPDPIPSRASVIGSPRPSRPRSGLGLGVLAMTIPREHVMLSWARVLSAVAVAAQGGASRSRGALSTPWARMGTPLYGRVWARLSAGASNQGAILRNRAIPGRGAGADRRSKNGRVRGCAGR